MPPALSPPPKSHPDRRDCDVLVLGAGLAGLRAAWAAKAADPRLSVLLVSPRRAPAGSSFANRNDALGIQAPQEHEAQAFVAEALRLALPGSADPELARVLAQDAPARLAELLALPLAFRRRPDGSLARFPGCFSPHPRALVFDGLAQAHAVFLARVLGLGVEMLFGCEALELLRDGSAVRGARLFALRGGQGLEVTARAVVAALGGPAPLYARRLCGPGGSGLSYGLLARAGARLVNARYLQFFWLRAADGGFVNPGGLDWSRLPGLEHLAELAEARRGHCPLSHGLPDAALDQALLARRGRDGLVRLPGQEPLALFAHAGNGGALIDAWGRTDVRGLLACGECAGGMHGANRLGGGMVLSALVFGARAGEQAARQAAGAARAPGDGRARPLDARPDTTFLRRLRRGMDVHGLPGATPAAAFLDWLRAGAGQRSPQRARLLALSALAVLGALPEDPWLPA